jgi:antibiotic biosynthesis monooxygenase (ABM) superfamily enzyme
MDCNNRSSPILRQNNPMQNSNPAKPKVWKMMLISWLFVYPVVNLMFMTIFPIIIDWHPLLRTLVFTVILVPLMGLTIPKLHKYFWAWITR